MGRLKAVQIIFLPVVIQHDEKLVSGLQNPAQTALKPDISGVRIILDEIGKTDKRREGVIKPIHRQTRAEVPLFQINPVLLNAK